jgi:predicted aspartyl protease
MPNKSHYFAVVVATFSCLLGMIRADELGPGTLRFANAVTSARLPGVTRNEKDHVFISARIIGHDEELRFVFDTGAGRTVIDRRVATRLGLKATQKSSVGGVGVGRLDVEVVKNASLRLGDVRLDGVDLNLVDDVHESEETAGVIGYDLLCTSFVTLDYEKPSIVVMTPSAYQYHGVGDVLALHFKGRWAYVRGELKVPGVKPVTDDFLIDTGSEDAVNHPIIRQSKGPLRETNTGAGGFGQSLRGVVGSNEWFRIGRTTIPATQSACCAGNDDVNRQLGSAILSHFRITFNYPASQIILEKY